MKKIDTWLDIQRFIAEAMDVPDLPRVSDEFEHIQRKLFESEIADIRIRRSVANHTI